VRISSLECSSIVDFPHIRNGGLFQLATELRRQGGVCKTLGDCTGSLYSDAVYTALSDMKGKKIRRCLLSTSLLNMRTLS
jgi:hypothetical protein